MKNSTVINIVSVSLLASLAMCSGIKAQNMLINPGAETGDLTGWNQSPGGYKYTVSTNQLVPNGGGLNYLAHSGSNTFELFDTTADSSYIYQDFPAIAGSQWSASSYIIGYAANYFGGGSSADMMVVFFDTNDNVVPYPPSSYGTFGSVILDTYGIVPPYDMILPPAVDASGWVYLQPTNIFTSYPVFNYNYDTSGPYPTTLTAPPGTAYVRYQLEYDNTAPPAGQPVYFDDCVLNKVVGSDPDISSNPVAVTLFATGSPSFSVTATHTGAYPTEKLKYQWYFNKTNLLIPGMNQISSSTTAATLNFTNVQGSASGLYDVVVTLTSAGVPVNSIRSVPVPLNVLVLDPIQKVNLLGANAGFENQPSWLPWNIFNGCYPAGPLSAANSTYDGTTPVVPYGGSWTALVGANGNTDNGFYLFYPVTPGELLQAGGYAYISSLNDFIGLNTERVQIWFVQDTSGTPVIGSQILESSKIYGLDYTNSENAYTNIDVSSPNYGQVMIHDQLPRDQWVYLGVTNITGQYFTGLYPDGPDLPTNTLANGYFQVPAGANYIKFQVYENVPGDDGNPADAVYWDEMRLIQVLPVPDLKASVSGGNVNLTFSAGPALSYTVLYKTNLTDTVWNILSNNIAAPLNWQTNTASVGISYPITVTDVPGAKTRFYRVQSN
jgi:hypothetical protein